MFDWLGDIFSGIGNAIGDTIEYLGTQIANTIFDAILQWFYEIIYGAVADFFTMMDNMGAPLLGQALELVPAHIEAEVSGGVTLETIRGIALTDPRHPDFISVGRLTHSAVAADFSMTLANA